MFALLHFKKLKSKSIQFAIHGVYYTWRDTHTPKTGIQTSVKNCSKRKCRLKSVKKPFNLNSKNVELVYCISWHSESKRQLLGAVSHWKKNATECFAQLSVCLFLKLFSCQFKKCWLYRCHQLKSWFLTNEIYWYDSFKFIHFDNDICPLLENRIDFLFAWILIWERLQQNFFLNFSILRTHTHTTNAIDSEHVSRTRCGMAVRTHSQHWETLKKKNVLYWKSGDFLHVDIRWSFSIGNQ